MAIIDGGRESKLVRLERYYDFLVQHKEENNGEFPTIRRIAEEFGVSTSVANYNLIQLYNLGVLRRAESRQSYDIAGGRWTAPPDPDLFELVMEA